MKTWTNDIMIILRNADLGMQDKVNQLPVTRLIEESIVNLAQEIVENIIVQVGNITLDRNQVTEDYTIQKVFGDVFIQPVSLNKDRVYDLTRVDFTFPVEGNVISIIPDQSFLPNYTFDLVSRNPDSVIIGYQTTCDNLVLDDNTVEEIDKFYNDFVQTTQDLQTQAIREAENFEKNKLQRAMTLLEEKRAKLN